MYLSGKEIFKIVPNIYIFIERGNMHAQHAIQVPNSLHAPKY